MDFQSQSVICFKLVPFAKLKKNNVQRKDFACVLQGDANRSESDDEKKSNNSEEDEKVEQFRDTGR